MEEKERRRKKERNSDKLYYFVRIIELDFPFPFASPVSSLEIIEFPKV